jgi:predicted amidohydrolase YtcJ
MYRYPEERISRDQALRGITIDSAYASFSESTVGSLEVGKKADFVVLSQDIMRIPFHEILKTKVKVTAVDGRLVYGRL